MNSQFREIASFPGVLLIVLGENRLIKIHLSDVPFPYLSLSRVHIRRENQGINHRVRRSRYLLIIIIHYTNIFQMTRLFRSFYFPPYIYIYIEKHGSVPDRLQDSSGEVVRGWFAVDDSNGSPMKRTPESLCWHKETVDARPAPHFCARVLSVNNTSALSTEFIHVISLM